jgi:hypothetical protein
VKIDVEVPASLTARWQPPHFVAGQGWADPFIGLYFGNAYVGGIPIPNGYAKNVRVADEAVQQIVAKHLAEKLLGQTGEERK